MYYDTDSLYAPRGFDSGVQPYGAHMAAAGIEPTASADTDQYYQQMLQALEEEHRKQQQKKQGSTNVSGMLSGGDTSGSMIGGLLAGG